MDIGTASALSLYNFNATAQSDGRSAAVLQALAQTYSDSRSAVGSDTLSSLLTTAGMAPVVNAMYTLASADGTGLESLPADAFQDFLSYGGMNTATASVLFSAGSSDSSASSGLMGFDSALTASSALALSAYQASQNFLAATQDFSSPLDLLG